MTLWTVIVHAVQTDTSDMCKISRLAPTRNDFLWSFQTVKDICRYYDYHDLFKQVCMNWQILKGSKFGRVRRWTHSRAANHSWFKSCALNIIIIMRHIWIAIHAVVHSLTSEVNFQSIISFQSESSTLLYSTVSRCPAVCELLERSLP